MAVRRKTLVPQKHSSCFKDALAGRAAPCLQGGAAALIGSSTPPKVK